ARAEKLVHKLFTHMSRRITVSLRLMQRTHSLMHLQRRMHSLFAALQIHPTRVFQRSSFEKVGSRRATNRVCSSAGNHAADYVAPPREELQDRPSRLAKKHCRPHIGSQRGDKLGCSPQAALAAADIHDS